MHYLDQKNCPLDFINSVILIFQAITGINLSLLSGEAKLPFGEAQASESLSHKGGEAQAGTRSNWRREAAYLALPVGTRLSKAWFHRGGQNFSPSKAAQW